MSLTYTIELSKDHAQVTAKWKISTEIDDTELIASFTLTVEGKALATQCSGGNKACTGATNTTLAKPTEDCPVTFAITTNGDEEAHGDDTLRGDRTFDDVSFASE